MTEAQQWLTDNYENKKDDTIEIKFNKGIELEGKLIIDGYHNLKKIFLGDAKGITELSINDCSNIEVIFVSRNQITKIEGLANLTKLQKLSFGNNKIEKIDISQNKQLELLAFAKSPKNFEFVNGIKDLSKLVFWNSDETFAITKLLEQASGADLKEIAEELGLNVDGKNSEEIKKIIKAEAEKNKQNKTKLNQEFPNLISDKNEIDDTKLKEIKSNFDKGGEYQKLVDEAVNSPIVSDGKIDQVKLTNELKESDDYKKLVTNNPKLTTEDGKEISQEKINNLKTASDDATEAIKILGVDNLKSDTLDAKLGGGKISDIPGSETLKSILEKNKKLEGALDQVGIDSNSADLEKRLTKWKNLEETVEEIYGENYEKILEVQEYQNQVEVNTNNN